MTLNVDFFGFAENAVTDNLGRVSLINVNPYFEAPTFPATFRHGIVLLASQPDGEDILPGQKLRIRFEIVDSTDKIIGAGITETVVGEKPSAAIEQRLNFVGDVVVPYENSGTYTTRIFVEVDGEVVLKAQKDMRIQLNARATPPVLGSHGGSDGD